MRQSPRVRFCIWLCSRLLVGGGHVIRFLAGADGVSAVFVGILELQRKVMAELPMNAARHGLARESSEMQANVDRFAAQLRPGTGWTFHKTQWGDHEVLVLPRVMDSNTGVVTGPEANPLLGSVVTNDHMAPNCDPSALQHILDGPSPGGVQ